MEFFFFFLGGGLFKTFLEGSVDRVIYRDYIVNRRFFIDCSLAAVLGAWWRSVSGGSSIVGFCTDCV